MSSISKNKEVLINRLKENKAFWSYDLDSIKEVPDSLIVELTLLHLDIEEIHMLFELYSFDFIKNEWEDKILRQLPRYKNLNIFLAWFLFKIKEPKKYIENYKNPYLA